MEKWVSIGKASKILGVSISALRAWERKGILIPNRTPTGHRRYDLSQLETLEIKKYQRKPQSSVYLYARVSTQKQADTGNLDRQIGRLTNYAVNHGYTINKIFKDIASGLNENRKGLQKLLQAVRDDNKSMIIIEYKDRLARFGFAYLERYITDFGGEIIIVEEKEANEQQELLEDLIAITTSFSARIYGQRGDRVAKKLTEAIKNEVNADENNG